MCSKYAGKSKRGRKFVLMILDGRETVTKSHPCKRSGNYVHQLVARKVCVCGGGGFPNDPHNKQWHIFQQRLQAGSCNRIAVRCLQKGIALMYYREFCYYAVVGSCENSRCWKAPYKVMVRSETSGPSSNGHRRTGHWNRPHELRNRRSPVHQITS
jgi:hypothetical protein